jgi:hypothetical protein
MHAELTEASWQRALTEDDAAATQIKPKTATFATRRTVRDLPGIMPWRGSIGLKNSY